jgi:predicted amidohydrolase YtcJ
VSLLLRDVEVEGERVDVRVTGERVAHIGVGLRADSADEVVAGEGGALLPGLHDHHLHLMALAAADGSVPCGPPDVLDEAGLRRVLRSPAGRSWVRGTGYHESVAGHLDREARDRLVPDRPVRVQHRSGALWVLNSRGLDEVGLERTMSTDVERDDRGRLTGRLWRWDVQLRDRLGAETPDLSLVERRLAGLGLTGLTDATPDLDQDTCARLRQAVRQRVQLLGSPAGPGPSKLLLRDHDLPDFEQLAAAVEAVRRDGRPVAVHCVTRDSLLLALAVLEQVGALPGDRVEHGSVVPPGVAGTMARLGVTVVTQPVFLADKGDDYLRDVAAEDRPLLYPYGSLLRAGVRVAPSSDAPFGDPDPWRGVAAAVHRRSRSGAVLGPHERVPARVALDGYLAPLGDPGGAPRRVAPGGAADLCLLHVPLAVALRDPSALHVRGTWVAGTRLWP